jgi:hypothetical protein
VLNRLSLRIEHGALRHYPNVCFHALSIALPQTGQAGRRCRRFRSFGGKNEYLKEFSTRRWSSLSVKPMACAFRYSSAKVT